MVLMCWCFYSCFTEQGASPEQWPDQGMEQFGRLIWSLIVQRRNSGQQRHGERRVEPEREESGNVANRESHDARPTPGAGLVRRRAGERARHR